MSESIFKKWSEKAAWLAGYVLANGCVSVQSRSCVDDSKYLRFKVLFECNVKDGDILKWVKLLLNCSGQIRARVERPTVCLQVKGDVLIYDMRQMGLVSDVWKKVVRFPKMPERYEPHFVRGYFDGDGSVTFYPTKINVIKRRIKITFCGQRVFLGELRQKLTALLGLRQNQIVENNDSYMISWAKERDVRMLYAWMYPRIGIPCCSRKRRIMVRVFDGV